MLGILCASSRKQENCDRVGGTDESRVEKVSSPCNSYWYYCASLIYSLTARLGPANAFPVTSPSRCFGPLSAFPFNRYPLAPRPVNRLVSLRRLPTPRPPTTRFSRRLKLSPRTFPLPPLLQPPFTAASTCRRPHPPCSAGQVVRTDGAASSLWSSGSGNGSGHKLGGFDLVRVTGAHSSFPVDFEPVHLQAPVTADSRVLSLEYDRGGRISRPPLPHTCTPTLPQTFPLTRALACACAASSTLLRTNS